MKIIVYIAHPIKGNVKDNLEDIRQIVRKISLENDGVVPFVPYWLTCYALNDEDLFERSLGIENNRVFFDRKVMQEVWLYGDRISTGMINEIKLAFQSDIPIVVMGKGLELKYIEVLTNIIKEGV